MLTLSNLHAFYGKSHVLHGVQLQVNAGEIVALLGRNGSSRCSTRAVHSASRATPAGASSSTG